VERRVRLNWWVDLRTKNGSSLMLRQFSWTPILPLKRGKKAGRRTVCVGFKSTIWASWLLKDLVRLRALSFVRGPDVLFYLFLSHILSEQYSVTSKIE
jgi:hypothetical protein